MTRSSGRDASPAGALRAGIPGRRCRALHLVLGDQLHVESSALARFDPSRDAVLMAELDEEATWTPSHRQRIAVFFAAMRHFALGLVDRGWTVRYVRANDPHNTRSFVGELSRAAEMLRPDRVVVTEPGEWRVRHALETWSAEHRVPLEIDEDRHFLTPVETFREWRTGRKRPIMEHFYRWQRKRLGLLIEDDGSPTGGAWNLDHENRESFASTPTVRAPTWPAPDAVTREVIDLVNRRYPRAPGRLDADSFIWPVTPEAAEHWLDEFVEKRLPRFGPYEDAMWTAQPFLYHSMLSVPLNLKLLDPRHCVERAIDACERGHAPLNSVEGFVRQLIGWREFIRGIYWTEGEDYRDRNSLDQHGNLPEFYWTGQTDMRCVSECLRPVLNHAWSHHIPRLMVLSSLAMMGGVAPRALGDWFYAMYADSVDWVTTPNTIGMGMHCDGIGQRSGVVGTKPYAASGKYIARMSNFCEHCPYDNSRRHGRGDNSEACPFNTFYWDFLIRNRERLRSNNRMAMALKNVDRMDPQERVEITAHAERLRDRFGVGAIEPPAARERARA